MPKKTKIIVEVINDKDNTKQTTQIQTGLTSKQIRNIKKSFKIMLPTKELGNKYNEKRKAKRRKITNILFFVFNVVVLAIVLIGSFVGQPATDVLFPTIEWKWIGILVGILILQGLIESTKYFILIKKSTKKPRFFLAYKVQALGKYYDAVTPMSTGGQPFQMMYLNKRGVKGDIATSIPLVRYMFWQITFVIICSVILIYNQFFSTTNTQVFSTLIAWGTVLANLLILLTVFFLSVSKKVGPLIVIWFLKLGSKLKIIKNYRVTFRKVMRFVVNYQKTMKMFAKNFFVLISQIVLAAAEMILFNLIPYFIYKAFVPTGTLSWVDIMTQSIICNLTTSLIPTPGASGGAELFFATIFGGIFKGNTFWPLLIWRISTYYINLLQGLLILVYDFLVGNKKYERQKLKEMGIKSTEPTFRQALAENRDTIDIVQDQEEDKLLVPTFFSYDKISKSKKQEEIIKDADLISPEEMKKEVYTAEQVLTKVRIREIHKKKQKKIKKQTKAQLKSEKKNSK